LEYYEDKTQTWPFEQQDGAKHFGKYRYSAIGARNNPQHAGLKTVQRSPQGLQLKMRSGGMETSLSGMAAAELGRLLMISYAWLMRMTPIQHCAGLWSRLSL
jgi:hypothetical protein